MRCDESKQKSIHEAMRAETATTTTTKTPTMSTNNVDGHSMVYPAYIIILPRSRCAAAAVSAAGWCERARVRSFFYDFR